VPEEPHWPTLLPPPANATKRRKRRNETPEDAEARERFNARAEEAAQAHRAIIDRCHETWRWAVGSLMPADLVSHADALILTDLAITWARLIQAEQEISTQGTKVFTERGWVRNSSVVTAGQYRQHWKWLAGQLGLSPVARDAMRGESGPGEDESPFDV
jgi:phage terminase small subunit